MLPLTTLLATVVEMVAVQMITDALPAPITRVLELFESPQLEELNGDLAVVVACFWPPVPAQDENETRLMAVNVAEEDAADGAAIVVAGGLISEAFISFPHDSDAAIVAGGLISEAFDSIATGESQVTVFGVNKKAVIDAWTMLAIRAKLAIYCAALAFESVVA